MKNIFKHKALSYAVILGAVATAAFGSSCVNVSRYYDANGNLVAEYSDVGEKVAMMDATSRMINASANFVGAAGSVAVPIVDMAVGYSTFDNIDHRHQKTIRMGMQMNTAARLAEIRARQGR